MDLFLFKKKKKSWPCKAKDNKNPLIFAMLHGSCWDRGFQITTPGLVCLRCRSGYIFFPLKLSFYWDTPRSIPVHPPSTSVFLAPKGAFPKKNLGKKSNMGSGSIASLYPSLYGSRYALRIPNFPYNPWPGDGIGSIFTYHLVDFLGWMISHVCAYIHGSYGLILQNVSYSKSIS